MEEKMKVVSFTSLPVWQQKLIFDADEARRHSSSPYSKFKVGAAIQCSQPNTDPVVVYLGCNVENAMYVVTHAEQAAINEACLNEPEKPYIIAIAVVLPAETIDQHALPCGYCRQWIREFGSDDTLVLGAKLNSAGDIWQVEVVTLEELLPFSFGPNNLGK
ncbi:MAG TPA: cytidine deaminase [Candidatus Magasanikbacteria bacterium]|nr:cytidine deaminase [Candidatus Magasanikbacteria bacterium]HBX15742.1 cytidine deaminase [Candidatus Magasanikbacteria bacterium]